MYIRNFFLGFILILASLSSVAQGEFTYTPEQPKPGERISFTYTPAKSDGKTEVFVISMSGNKPSLTDIKTSFKKGVYSGTFTPDTSANLLAFGFKDGNTLDDNDKNGFFVPLYENNQPRSGAYANMARMVTQFSEFIGVPPSSAKAKDYFEKEFELYPGNKTGETFFRYLGIRNNLSKDEGAKLIQDEIEKAIKAGLREKEDYRKIETLYGILRLPEQQKFIRQLTREKFTTLDVKDYYQLFLETDDVEKKEEIYEKVAALAKGNSPDVKDYNQLKEYFQPYIAQEYSRKQDWDGFKKAAARIESDRVLASLYHNTAWTMQKLNRNPEYATEIAAFAADYAKAQVKKPTHPKPDMLTNSQWDMDRRELYARYADTYALLLNKKKEYKKALDYAKDAAINMTNGRSFLYNGTYAMLAEKVLKPKQYQKQLEDFVKKDAADSWVKSALENAYAAKQGSKDGFEEYYENLKNQAKVNAVASLKDKMLNQPPPDFSLKDLTGKTVSLADYKDKIVVIDFWATWCGPCKAAFPAMQDVAKKYKNDPTVQFVYINTMERTENKEKAVQDYLNQSKHDLYVLMDNESKVSKDFGVVGIPAKFIIGKDGKIKFKSVGFEGASALDQELTAMIEFCK